jgi:hypothetical protein
MVGLLQINLFIIFIFILFQVHLLIFAMIKVMVTMRILTICNNTSSVEIIKLLEVVKTVFLDNFIKINANYAYQ